MHTCCLGFHGRLKDNGARNTRATIEESLRPGRWWPVAFLSETPNPHFLEVKQWYSIASLLIMFDYVWLLESGPESFQSYSLPSEWGVMGRIDP